MKGGANIAPSVGIPMYAPDGQPIMIDFLIKAAIILFLIVPLVLSCILFVIAAEYLKYKDEQQNEQ